MFSNISWSLFITGIITVLAVYYLSVFVLYYTTEIKNAILGKTRKGGREPEHGELPAGTEEEEPVYPPEQQPISALSENDVQDIEDLVHQLKSLVADMTPDKRLPGELKTKLMPLFKAYPSVKYSTLRHSVNALVVSEWEKYSVIVLNEEEVNQCW